MEKPIIILKIGSSTLTAGTHIISRGKIEDVARQLVELRDKYAVIIVSSGAIATAKQFVKTDEWQDVVHFRQAMSAIGQPKLMQIYHEVFGDFNLQIAQCLLTYKDFEEGESRKNTYNTLKALLHHGFIPIVNENDTVAVEELIVGDNDKLSAHVAVLVDAQLLVLASDIDGIYDKNPHLHPDARLFKQVNDIAEVVDCIEEIAGGLGTGGMTSKLTAARICSEKNIEMILVNGGRSRFLIDSLNNKIPHTKFMNR